MSDLLVKPSKHAEDGQIIARSEPGAMITAPETAARRVVEMVKEGVVITASGKRLPTPFHSICVHGDSPHAVVMARRVRQALEDANIRLSAFA